MRKSLLLGSVVILGATTMQALPTAPQSLPKQTITKISPDGRYVVCEEYGVMMITDLETDNQYVYGPESESDMHFYTSGHGKAWSDNGIMVGNTMYDGCPEYWQNGEWHTLPYNADRTIYLTGINADGSMICGIGSVLASDNLDTLVDVVPMIWTLGEDGNWSQPVILPYPEIDFTGRPNQYVYAHVISDDGKTIFGHTHDYSGRFNFPILYEKDEKGEWSYRMVAEELINPNHYEFEDPGEFDMMQPNPETYMNDEQLEDYHDALEAYYASGYQQEYYPDVYDYMTDEMYARYQEDLAFYETKAMEFNELLEKFYINFDKLTYEQPLFSMNVAYMDGKGTMAAMRQDRIVFDDTSIPEGPSQSFCNPYIFDLTTGESAPALIEGVDKFTPTAMTSDGTLLAYGGKLASEAYIKLRDKEWLPLYDYIRSKASEEVKSWMEENICHSFTYMDTDTGMAETYENLPMLGFSCASDDLSIFASSVDTLWDLQDENYSYGYIIPLTGDSAVGTVASDGNISLKALPGAVLALSGKTDVEVYDMQGRRVFAAKDAEGNINTGLAGGIYTVKATYGSDSCVIKALF